MTVRWSLRYTIFALTGGMVLSLLGATFLVIGWHTRQATRQRLASELQSTQQQFEALQQLRYQSLLALGQVLSHDYALRNAVATYDPPTVASALHSVQARTQSDVVLITDDHGAVLAATGELPTVPLATHPMIRQALQGMETLHIWPLQDQLYQVATVPLRTGPDLLGTLSLGYALDHEVLQKLQSITGSAITVTVGASVLVSTWPPATQVAWQAAFQQLTDALADGPSIQTLVLEGETYLTLTVPLGGPQQQPVGGYILQRSLDQELALLYHMQRLLLGTGLGAMGLALVGSFLMARSVTAPVQALVQGAEAVARGDYHYRVPVTARNELGVLAQAYNRMMEQLAAHLAALHTAYHDLQQQTQALEASLRKITLLEHVQRHLGKFVPESVKRLIEQTPTAPALEKRDCDVTVVFLDIAGYTRLSEHHSRDQMNRLIERYFSRFLDAIHTYHGDINETAGDGLMILFQDADPLQHALNALHTALAIHQQTQELHREVHDMEPLVINIGINSGIAAVGSTRFTGLTGERWTFTASGSVTNIAARLAELATSGVIYVGEETARRVRTRIPLRCLGKKAVKNVQEPLSIYEVDF